MSNTRIKLTHEMREAGYSKSAIDAAWPSWWTDEAESSPSARAELRLALSRRLGLSPGALLGARVEFIWDDSARFKHLRIHNPQERAAIASFGIALGRDLIAASPQPELTDWHNTPALRLRESILTNRQFVDLQSLIALCWAFGIPVIQLGIVPLESKSMHAMVAHHQGRFAILLARNARFPPMAAFTLAHELGHILLGHIEGASALIDLDNSAEAPDKDADEQERQADEFALILLTGSAEPVIEIDRPNYNAPTLARAAIAASQKSRVEPGTIALSLAYRDGSWARTMSALKFIYGNIESVSRSINAVARQQLAWDNLTDDAAKYVDHIMTISDA